MLEAAFGGWLSGLFFAAVDLTLVSGRVGIHISGRRLAAMIGVAFAFYPLAGGLAGVAFGLLAARRRTGGREPTAASAFLILSSLWLAILAGAYLLFRVWTRTEIVWRFAISAGCLLLGAIFLLGIHRLTRWTIPLAGRLVLGTLWCGSLGVLWAYAHPGPALFLGTGKPEKLVILITADTLRGDALGAYGNHSARTPNLDAFAAEGALFLRAQAASCWTLPSHASMLTGLTVPQHGANGRTFALRESAVTIAERFRINGFRTEAVTSCVFTSSELLGSGFDFFDDLQASPWRWLAVASFARKLHGFLPIIDVPIQRRAGEVVDQALSRLHGNRALFLWLHFFDPHTDYDPPPAFRGSLPLSISSPFDGRALPLDKVNQGQLSPPSASELSALRTLYDGEVSYLDDQIGRLRREIEKEGLASRTSLVFVADHGEAFLEHGLFLHATLHQEELHVPLIVWAPGRVPPGSRVESTVRGIDVAPTLAELGGIRWSSPGEAISLIPLLTGAETVSRPARSDRDTFSALGQKSDSESSLLVWPWKLIYRPSDRRINLFNLDRDPGETRDISKDESLLAEKLVKALAAGDLSTDSVRPRTLDSETIRQLRSLGYIR